MEFPPELIFLFLHIHFWFAFYLKMRKADIADTAWGLGILGVTFSSALPALREDHLDTRILVVLALTFLWAFRLSAYLWLRSKGKPEDQRYTELKKDWKTSPLLQTYLKVFVLQTLFLYVVSWPTRSVVAHPLGTPLQGLDLFGIGLVLFGILFESISDWQMLQFKKDPKNKGRVITTGLWRWSRHPNYFGEIVLWWGFFLIALSQASGWISILGPLLITVLISFLTGIPIIEKRYAGRPEWEDYKRRTSPLIPWKPRQAPST